MLSRSCIQKSLKNIVSINTLYSHIYKNVELVSAYTDNKDLSSLIKICRLKPYNLLGKNLKINTVLYYWWVDEYNNSFKINQKKEIKIILSDLSIKRKYLTSSDLYGQLHVSDVAKFSKLVYILAGKDEDLNKDHTILAFLGIDDFLRVFVLTYGEWKQYSPLNLGLDILLKIVNNLNITTCLELSENKPVIYPCSSQKEWLSYWPSESLVSVLKQNNESILDIINIKE